MGVPEGIPLYSLMVILPMTSSKLSSSTDIPFVHVHSLCVTIVEVVA